MITASKSVLKPDRIRRFAGEYAFLDNGYREPDGTSVEEEWAYSKDLYLLYRLVWGKFRDHPALRKKLLDTGHSSLEMENYKGDRYLGTVHGLGSNWMGEILMLVRKQMVMYKSELFDVEQFNNWANRRILMGG